MKKLFPIILVFVVAGVFGWQALSIHASGYPKYATEVVYHAADFSGDGKKVYFLKEVIGWKQVKPRMMWDGWGVEERHLWLCSVRPDGKDRKQIKELFPRSDWILNKTEGFVNMAVCPKDDRIAWSSSGCMDEIDGLWVMDADGKNLKKVLEKKKVGRIYNPAWSPADKYIVVDATVVHDEKIWRVSAAGCEAVCLSGVEIEKLPCFSPDGRQIAFTRVVDPSNLSTELWVMDSDGKNRRKILGANNIAKWNRQWLPDGKRIVFWDGGRGNMVVDVETKNIVRLVELPGDKISPKEDYVLSVGSRGFFVSPRGSVKAEDPYFGFANRYVLDSRLKGELRTVSEIW